MIKAVLLDLGGVLYVGDDALPGAADALRKLDEAGLPVRAITNTTRRPRRAVLEKLTRLELPLAEEAVFTAPDAARRYLDAHGLRPWLLVHPDIVSEFAPPDDEPGRVRSDAARPNAVLVADAGEAFGYRALNHAFRLLLDGATLLATGVNRHFREADGHSLDAGPFVKALEFAAGTEAVVLGKPSAGFFHAALEGLDCAPDEAVMVGDDVESDVGGAIDAGLQGILVRTGKYRCGDERQLEGSGALVADGIGAAVDLILERRA